MIQEAPTIEIQNIHSKSKLILENLIDGKFSKNGDYFWIQEKTCLQVFSKEGLSLSNFTFEVKNSNSI